VKPQAWLAPLTPPYAAAVVAKNAAYDHGLLRQKKLRGPVISIGNLSTGGGGKTPFVIALAKLLTNAGISVDVLSRGYGRSSDAVERVDPGPQATAVQFGDEPLLIARSAAVPGYVGRSRYAAGLLAEQDAGSGPPIHLLDDGFQHRQLARDLDIVLLHREDFKSRLLPAGHLREPLSALRRAQVAVLRDEGESFEKQVRAHVPEMLIWHIRRTVTVPPGAGPAMAFCGIARPEEFFSSLEVLGAIVARLAFPDHHRYSNLDLDGLCGQAKVAGASRFITTEKDFVRLHPAALATLQQCAPVEIARLEVSIVEADAAVNLVRQL
jgi:tetraacyldisaccharide 4'-kinase